MYISVLRYFLLEERCRFLSNFSIATADVDIPGDYLMPKVRSTCMYMNTHHTHTHTHTKASYS